MAPNFSVTGFQPPRSRKLKPKVRSAGHDAETSETMMPPRMTRTAMAAARVRWRKARRPTADAAALWRGRPARRIERLRLATPRQPRAPPGRLHPALLGLSPSGEPLKRPAAATQAACSRRWTRKGRRSGALSHGHQDQLVIANTGLPLASLISLFQYCSMSLHDVGRHRDIVEVLGHLAAVLVGPGEELQRFAGRRRHPAASCG